MTWPSRLAAPWPPSALYSAPSRSRSRPCCCSCSLLGARASRTRSGRHGGSHGPLRIAGWGVLVAIAWPVLAVAAAASILGLPLGLSVLLGFGLVALVGYALAAYAVGRLIVQAPRGRAGAVLAGWGAAAAIGVVPFLNVLVWVFGSMFGLGAAVVAIWRARAAYALTRPPPGGVGAGPCHDRRADDDAADIGGGPHEPAEGAICRARPTPPPPTTSPRWTSCEPSAAAGSPSGSRRSRPRRTPAPAGSSRAPWRRAPP